MAGLEEHSPIPAKPFGGHSFSFPIAAPQEFAASSKVTPLPIRMPLVNGEVKASKPMTPPRKKKAVLYFTSLRGVRATHEDCCLARAILKGYGVRINERDVSMHREFRDELHGLLGPRGGALTKCWAPAAPIVPSLFVDEEFVGKADELKRLHENGELAARLAGCESAAFGESGACEACGDARFVLCEACSGSYKVYVDEEDEGEEGILDDGGALEPTPSLPWAEARPAASPACRGGSEAPEKV